MIYFARIMASNPTSAAAVPATAQTVPRAAVPTEPLPQDGTVEVEDDADSSFGDDYKS